MKAQDEKYAALERSSQGKLSEQKGGFEKQIADMKSEHADFVANMDKQGGAAAVLAEEKLKTSEEKADGQIRAMEKKVAEADQRAENAEAAMQELAGTVSEAATTAPAMLRAAKGSSAGN